MARSEAASARIGSNINCVSGHLAYYEGAAGTTKIETAADGGIWRTTLDRHDEYNLPFLLR